MKLIEMKRDTFGKVESLKNDERFLKRITSIGLTEGTSFQVVKNDRKMPVLVYVRESLIALNRNDCESIEVKEVKAFSEKIDMDLIDTIPFFKQARKQLRKQLKLCTRIAMKVVDEGSRKGYLIYYRKG